MTQVPTLAQLLKKAINDRLIDVHTALIGRIERYDHTKQLADVQPVLKSAGSLPLLVDVPIVFPQGGGYFISLPIKKGDFVQVIINESSLDEFLTESPDAIDAAGRLTLQGAVAIPGVSRLSKPLTGAHQSNLVIGKSDGVQIHIDDSAIRLGSESASEAVAIASKVMSELSDFSFDDDALTRTITIRFKAKLFDQRAIHRCTLVPAVWPVCSPVSSLIRLAKRGKP